MIRILHLFDSLYLTGAIRSVAAIAKYSNHDLFEHKVIAFQGGDSTVMTLFKEAKIESVATNDRNIIKEAIKNADIVELNWWHSPRIMELLLSDLPEMRFMTFYHVVGNTSPHIITKQMINYSDMNVVCNPYTYNKLDVFKSMSDKERTEKVCMVYPAAEFARIEGFKKKDHPGFNVGYIGTIDFIKIHPRYFEMSNTVNIPDVNFILCGDCHNPSVIQIQKNLKTLLIEDKFKFLGYVNDITEPLSIMDVFGYPLCENTYAAGELVLQEVMYAGIVPVVFPYGGVQSLVVNDFTGIVVRTEREYIQAVEFLFHNPNERLRIGRNASEYAKQTFGGEIVSKKMDSVYLNMMNIPKRKHVY